MKRKVISIFAVVGFLLVLCTMVSQKAEKEMQTQVVLRQVKGSRFTLRNATVPLMAVKWPGGEEKLYQVVNGSGWESGLRVSEIPRYYYSIGMGSVELGPGTDYRFIQSASRTPVPGDGVEVVEESEKGTDQYLILCPDGMAKPEKIPISFEIQGQNDTAVLIQTKNAVTPFFEHRVVYSLRNIGASQLRVYSMNDARTFLQALPRLAGLLAVLACGLLLLGCSCVLSSREENGQIVLWINGLLAVGMLCTVPRLLSGFDLPSSLMPADNILDIGHFTGTFSAIFHALEGMGSDLLIAARDAAAGGSALVLGTAIGITAAIIVVEVLLCRRRRIRIRE